MDFEKNRQELLSKLGKMKKQHVLQNPHTPKVAPSAAAMATANKNTGSKIRAAIFCNNPLFVTALKAAMSVKANVTVFNKTTEAIDTCAEEKIPVIVIDLDSPSTVNQVLEVLLNLKAVMPEIQCIVCTEDKTSKDAMVVNERGAIVIEKPISTNELHRLLDSPQPK
jgi:hypothetical protein